MDQVKTSVEGITRRVLEKFEVLKSQKQELFELFNNIDEFHRIFCMMQQREIIRKADHKKIQDMMELPGISAKLEHGEKLEPGEIRDSLKFRLYIGHYPLVVDADRICTDSEYKDLADDGIYVVRKQGKVGLGQRFHIGGLKSNMLSHIKELIPPIYGDKLFYEDYKKHGIIGFYGNVSSPKITFYQKNGEYGDFKQIDQFDNCDFFGGFDKDNVGICYFRDDTYGILHLIQGKDGALEVRRIQTFNTNKIGNICFNRNNSLEVYIPKIGNVVLKKSYDKEGKFIGIDVFKKSFFGKEAKEAAYHRKMT